MLVGWYVRGGYNMDLSEEGQYGGSIGAKNKQADYQINIDQTHAYITTIGTGEVQKVKHEELNDWFINDNL